MRLRSYRRDELKKFLEKYSIKHGDFTLRSGKKSDFYVDCRPVLLSNEGHHLVADAMIPHLYELECECVVCTGVGGVHIASAVSMGSTFYDIVHVRSDKKAHGTMNKIEKPVNFLGENNLVIVDDVLTTGSSIAFCADALAEENMKPIGVVVLVDREEGGREAIGNKYNIPVISVFKKSDFKG